VHYLGKAATFILLFAFPTLLLAQASPGTHWWAYPLGWAMAWWGIVLYWIAGAIYINQVVGVVRTAQAQRAAA
jgi:cardiolipin synthase